MHLKLVSSEGSDLDDKTWEYIIEVLDVRILLEYERVATLVDDRLKRLSFSDHVYLVAGPVVHRQIPPNRRAGLVRITAVGNEQENQEQRAVPWDLLRNHPCHRGTASHGRRKKNNTPPWWLIGIDNGILLIRFREGETFWGGWSWSRWVRGRSSLSWLPVEVSKGCGGRSNHHCSVVGE